MSKNILPTNNASIYDSLTGAQKSLLAYPTPFPGGIAGLIFDWTGEERLELRSSITDSYTENNTTIHDQIALAPERFSVNVSTAEVVFAPQVQSAIPPQPANPLPLNAPLVPALTPGATQAQAANAVPSAAPTAAASTLYTYYKSLAATPPTKQALILGFIYQLWKGRVLFTVETPWGIMDSMAIEMADSTQPETTTGRTDHFITFKKLRLVKELTVSQDQLLGRAYNQALEVNPSLNGNIGQADISTQSSNQYFQNWINGIGGFGP